MSCNVIIIDDHPLFSRGLSQLIETQRDYKVIGMAKNRNEALTLLDNTTPDLAIVDLNLGQEDGLELIKDIIVIHPQTKIIRARGTADQAQFCAHLQFGDYQSEKGTQL